MITRVILYAIIIASIICLSFKQLKKHLILLVFIGLLTLSLSVIIPTIHDVTTIVGDSKIVGNYKDLGSVYYDENNNVYFVIKINPWNVFDSLKKTDIDYNLGELVSIATHITDEMENLMENYK